MTYVRNSAYRYVPFSSETAKDEFYTFCPVSEMPHKCEARRNDVTLCRTIGILHSIEGHFYITDVHSPVFNDATPIIRLSLKYFKKETLPSTVVPYAVQIFGSLQWKDRAVLYVKIVQVLSTSMAIKLHSALTTINQLHLARDKPQQDGFEDSIPEISDSFIEDLL